MEAFVWVQHLAAERWNGSLQRRNCDVLSGWQQAAYLTAGRGPASGHPAAQARPRTGCRPGAALRGPAEPLPAAAGAGTEGWGQLCTVTALAAGS